MSSIKTQQQILEKLGIKALNPMQEEALTTIPNTSETIILSPTGSGKTLAFLLPLMQALDPESKGIQLLIVVPTRELAIQIDMVIREMGSGYKTCLVYGGRPFSKDKIELKTPPSILIGTPGRICDHLERETIAVDEITALVLDEFDKSLEIGFEKEMKTILQYVAFLQKKVLTSATQGIAIPKFVGLENPKYINYLKEGVAQLTVKSVVSPTKDKLHTLVDLICHLGNQPGIIFCNYKDTIQRVSDYLKEQNVPHGCFYGGMEQKERERALLKFRNGTHQLIIATDLAARGIDVPELKFIIHYQLPFKAEEFTHRNGRTARMNNEGTAYILKWEEDYLPEFIGDIYSEKLIAQPLPQPSPWTTLFISGGRKDKISKGDIAGLLFKQGQLPKEAVGIIELKPDCAFVAVHRKHINSLLPKVNNTRLKKKKVRVTEV